MALEISSNDLGNFVEWPLKFHSLSNFGESPWKLRRITCQILSNYLWNFVVVPLRATRRALKQFYTITTRSNSYWKPIRSSSPTPLSSRQNKRARLVCVNELLCSLKFLLFVATPTYQICKKCFKIRRAVSSYRFALGEPIVRLGPLDPGPLDPGPLDLGPWAFGSLDPRPLN